MVGDGGSKYTPTNSVKLYARWTDKYTITYKTNGGEINATSDKVKIGESISLRTPTRTGYVFEGWYSSSDFSGSPIVPNNYTPSSNVTLFAKWRELTATEMMDNFEQDNTYQVKVPKYVNTTKKATLLSIGRSLALHDYEPAFIAGFLGHVTPEGNFGYFEKYSGNSQQSYLLDWQSINLPDYISEYSGKYIMDTDFTRVQNIISILKTNGWQKNSD